MAHIPNPYFLLDLEHRKDMPLDVAKSIDLINEVKSDGKIAYFCSADGPFAAWIKKAVRDESLHNGNWTDRDIPVQDQGPHKSCWSTSGSENISDARHIHGVDMEYTPYSGQYLMDFVDLEAAKKRLNSSNGNHYCYGYSTFLALVYAMRHGMPTRDNWKGVGCGRKNFPDGNLGDVRLKHVLNDVKIFGDVNKACDYLRIQPILGSLAIFKPDFSTVEDGIYRGPQSPESKFSSWHSVSIRSITVEDGETIAFVKNSHGLKSGVDGYIKVSMDVVLMELKNDETPFFLSPGRLFRSFTYGEVRAEYEKEVVEWYIDGEKKDDQVTGSEKTASLILEGIFNNTFGKVYENEDGENEIVGSPTDRAIFKWAIQLQLRMNFLYSKNGSSTIRGSPCNSKSKCRGVVVNVKTRHTEGIRVHWIGNAKFLLGKCTQYDSNGENLHLSETKETELKDAINDMAARKLFCIAIAFTEISKKDMPRTSSARKQWVLPCENLTLLAIFGIKNPCLLGEDETQAPLDFEDEVEPDGNRARFALVDRVDMVDNAICPSISQGLKKFAIWTIGAVDNSEEKLNYDQVFMRHFVPSSLVFLKNKEPETVRNYILKTKSLCLQSWEKQIDRFQLGEGAMPASLKDSSRFFSRMMPEKTIITSETSNSSPLNPSSSRIICHVCNKQFSQYTCPRCNFRYCSLPCYKSHSVQYTESFMKENVNDELRQVRSDDQTKMKMLEILKRFHEEEEDEEIDSITDDEGWILPEEIIQKVMNGDEVSLDDLSLEERKGFQRALASGELSKMIQPWDPWWLRAEARSISLGVGGTQLVQCVEEEDEKEEATTDVSEIPRGPDTPLISLSKLSSTNPSPFLPLHLIDIVYSYCFTLRIYNGEWQSDSLGSATMVLSVSSVLGHNAQPETIKEVLSFCLEQTCSSAYKNLGGGLKFGLNLVDDVICLLSLGSGAMVCLLCDLQRLIHGAIQEVKSGRDLKKKLKLAERKVFFMMCWVNEQSSEVCQALESSVRAEKNSVVELNDCKGVPKMKKKDQFRKGGGVVIEEIE